MGALMKECGQHLAARGLCLKQISILCLSALILMGAEIIIVSWVFKERAVSGGSGKLDWFQSF